MGGGWSDEDDDNGYSGFSGAGGNTAVEESVPPSSAVTWSRTGGDLVPEPAAAPTFDWSGLWSCCYAPKSTRTFDKIRMRQQGDRVIGVKAEGDSCIGKNWVLLEASLPPGATSGRGRRLMYAKSKAGKSVRPCHCNPPVQQIRTEFSGSRHSRSVWLVLAGFPAAGLHWCWYVDGVASAAVVCVRNAMYFRNTDG